jgi:hypothetical protein
MPHGLNIVAADALAEKRSLPARLIVTDEARGRVTEHSEQSGVLGGGNHAF